MPEPIRSAMAPCPHCGIRVYFLTNGVCPSCGTHSARAPDAESAARIRENQEDLARRVTAPDHRLVRSRQGLIVGGLGAIAAGVALTWLTVAHDQATGSGASTAFYGLVIVGVLSLMRAASLPVRVDR